MDFKDLEQRVLSRLGINRVLHVPDRKSILIADDILPQDVERIESSNINGL